MIFSAGSHPAGLNADNCRQVLVHRARALARIREYFAVQQVLEVETPLLRAFGVTDHQLENLKLPEPFTEQSAMDKWLYLQTSPEYAMKQLLAKGSGSIYQLGKAFRRDPVGRWHAVEFTLLEWYRVGFSLPQLMDEVAELVGILLEPRPVELRSYREIFSSSLGLDPIDSSLDDITSLARQKIDIDTREGDRDFWLDLLLTHCIEPTLGQNCYTFVTDYPPSQAALARLRRDERGAEVAERFELYIDGVEIANGYHELTSAAEYEQRFASDNQRRVAAGLETVEPDREFLDAIEDGLPQCSGVALGFDRLVLLSLQHLQQQPDSSDQVNK